MDHPARRMFAAIHVQLQLGRIREENDEQVVVVEARTNSRDSPAATTTHEKPQPNRAFKILKQLVSMKLDFIKQTKAARRSFDVAIKNVDSMEKIFKG